MQDIGHEFKIKRTATEDNLLYIYNMYIYWTAISKPHGNCKLKIYIRYTHTHTHTQRINHKKTKAEGEKKRPKETKTINKMSIITCIDN